MITRLLTYEGTSFDPHYNLAIEQHLLETVEENTCILYLWQNQNTVVIGRNQNAWKECNTVLLEQEGGRLARRLSGGGAVFHDLGNLNFTFLVPQSDYDLDKQLTVIERAANLLGIHAERSGRNDVLAEGRKFSGNAFYRNGKQAYHHGTLLVSVDMEKLNRYLSPSKAKLQSKGVDSIRSRVVNLQELNPEITIEKLKQALVRALEETYALPSAPISGQALNAEAIDALTQRNRSWEWTYGQKIPFTYECEGRFPWGGVQIALGIENGIIRQAKVYSDSMDWEIAPRLEQALVGSHFSKPDIQNHITAAGIQPDVAEIFTNC